MAKYKLVQGFLTRMDGVSIPIDPANRDYAEYLAWVEVGGVPDSETLADAKARRKDELANIRQAQEERGIQVGDGIVRTNGAAQLKLAAAVIMAGRQPNKTVRWKMADGSFRTLNRAQMEAAFDVVSDFVAACYAWESALAAMIDAGQSIAEIDAINLMEGWP